MCALSGFLVSGKGAIAKKTITQIVGIPLTEPYKMTSTDPHMGYKRFFKTQAHLKWSQNGVFSPAFWHRKAISHLLHTIVPVTAHILMQINTFLLSASSSMRPAFWSLEVATGKSITQCPLRLQKRYTLSPWPSCTVSYRSETRLPSCQWAHLKISTFSNTAPPLPPLSQAKTSHVFDYYTQHIFVITSRNCETFAITNDKPPTGH